MAKALARQKHQSDIRQQLEGEMEHIEEASPLQVYEISRELLGSPLAGKIPSGNRNYLQKFVSYYDTNRAAIEKGTKSADKLAAGAKKHLVDALSHQVGTIGPAAGSGHSIYERIQEQITKLHQNMSENNFYPDDDLDELIEVIGEVTTKPELNKVKGQEANIKTMKLLLDGYQKRAQTNPEEAHDWLRAQSSSGKVRAQSLLNIIEKSYLPNLAGYAQRQRESGSK